MAWRGANNMTNWGEFEMHETYCLTALEAAEMAGVEISEIMRLAADESTVAVKVGDAWRVDPAALNQALRHGGMRRAA
jgi:hypothetical protein